MMKHVLPVPDAEEFIMDDANITPMLNKNIFALHKTYMLLLCLLLINLSNCNQSQSTQSSPTIAMDTYEWFPTACAPQHYPCEILKGDFVYKNGNSIYIPEGSVLKNGWGQIGSTHVTGENDLKPLPEKLIITWFSYTENRFFSGEFNLPAQVLATKFSTGFTNPVNKKKTTYTHIVAGVAPGGFVSLWVSGEGIVTEIATFEAKEADVPWENFFNDKRTTRKEFVEENLKESVPPDVMQQIKDKGVPHGLWKKYAESRYNWQPFFYGTGTAENIWVSTFNGERQFIDYTTKPAQLNKPAIPEKLELKWIGDNQTKYSAVVTLNEQEVFTAYEKLSPPKTDSPLKLQLEVSEGGGKLKIALSNEQYLLELEKCDVKVYKR